MLIEYNDNSHFFSKYNLSASTDDLRSLETLANSLRDLKLQKIKQLEIADLEVSTNQEMSTKASALLENDNVKAAALRRELSTLKAATGQARNVGTYKFFILCQTLI